MGPSGLPAAREASEEVAITAEQNGEYILAAREYSELAKTAPASKKVGYQLRYTEALIHAGQISGAKQALSEIRFPRSNKEAQAYRHFLRALIASHEGSYERSMHLLNKAKSVRRISPRLTSKIRLVMSETELALGNPIGAAKNLIIREASLTEPTEIDQNQIKIWEVLSPLKSSRLKNAHNLARGPILRGWLELAMANSRSKKMFRKTLKDWPDTHPKHPATKTMLSTLSGAGLRNIGHINRVGLLLPLSSQRYGVAAQAVREGIRVVDSADRRPDKPYLKVYDIGDDAGEADKFYALAVQEGAQLIIGPLGKEAINEVVDHSDLDVPTLLLGNTEEDVSDSSAVVLQFGLSPEQEARQAAERAYLDGHRTASILYANTEMSSRLLEAFTEHWSKLGGLVLSKAEYETGLHDYRDPVKQLLSISGSEARKQRLQEIVKKKIKFQPRRRQDIDCIFLAADAKHGRLIKPQLNYHRAARLPVYATSHIFTGRRDPIKDADLDGILFGDMPWMILSEGDVYELRMRQGNWPYAYTQLDRLFALGMDSYAVIPYLSKINADTSQRFSGVTSELRISKDGQMHRQLLWSKFRRGIPKPLESGFKYSGQIN